MNFPQGLIKFILFCLAILTQNKASQTNNQTWQHTETHLRYKTKLHKQFTVTRLLLDQWVALFCINAFAGSITDAGTTKAPSSHSEAEGLNQNQPSAQY